MNTFWGLGIRMFQLFGVCCQQAWHLGLWERSLGHTTMWLGASRCLVEFRFWGSRFWCVVGLGFKRLLRVVLWSLNMLPEGSEVCLGPHRVEKAYIRRPHLRSP